MKNKADFFLDGMNKFINGFYSIHKTIECNGSWQRKSTATGFNSLSELFPTVPAYHSYIERLRINKDIRWLQLSISKDGKDYELYFPHILCAVKKLREILTTHGFITNELI